MYVQYSKVRTTRSPTRDRFTGGFARSVVALAFSGACLACGEQPPVPTEEDARAAFEQREPRLDAIEQAVRTSIADAGLSRARPSCSADECIAQLRSRDEAIALAQKQLERMSGGSDVACSEIAISTPGAGEELAWRVATCPPGRRGDTIDPDNGLTIGDYQIGRGVYFNADQVMHPGISVRREIRDGDATATIEIYYFTD